MDSRYVNTAAAAAAVTAAASASTSLPLQHPTNTNDNTSRLSPLQISRDDNSSLPPLKSSSNNENTITTNPISTAPNSSNCALPLPNSTTPGNSPEMAVAIYDIAKLLNAKCTVFRGKVYNDKGHPICGVLNQHDRPCGRIGKCPFHFYSTPVTRDNVCNGQVDATGTAIPDHNNAISRTSYDPTAVANGIEQPRLTPPKKMQYKHGWSKEEHYLFLSGLRTHGRGAWKQIAIDVKTRTATQVQSHAQKFYLRQKQRNKNKRSIHDLTLDSPEMTEIEKQLALDPNNPLNRHHHNQHQQSHHHHHHHHHHNGNPPPPPPTTTNSFDEFGSMFGVTNTHNNHHDSNRSLGLSPLDRASVAAAGFPLSFRPNLTGTPNSNARSNVTAPLQPNQASIPTPWYAQPTRSPPLTQQRTTSSHDWTSATASLPLDQQRYAEKRADALLDAAAAAPLRPPPQGADSLLYGTTATNGFANTYGTTTPSHPGAPTATATPQSYEEARAFGGQEAPPSTSVLLGHGDGVSDILSGGGSLKGITKPPHQFRGLRSQRRLQSSAVSSSQQQLLAETQPFDQLTSPVTTQHSIPHAFLSGVDLQVGEHHPGEVQQPPRDVGALLSGAAGRVVSTGQNER